MSIEAFSAKNAESDAGQLKEGQSDAPTPITSRLKTWLVDAAVATAFTFTLIEWSLRHGRLLFYPQYDDVAYMRTSLLQLGFMHNGFWAFLQEYFTHPPHAPFTELLGMASYAVFGRHDWAPYAGNGLLLLVVLRLMRRVLFRVPPPYRWAAIFVAMSTPLFGELIVDMRPDLFYGLLMAFSVTWITSRPLVTARPFTWMKAGALFGVLLFVKTSVYPQTLMFLCLALGTRTLCDWIDMGRQFPMRRAAVSWATVIVTAIIIVTPHYYVALGQINSYIYDTLFGDRKGFWQFHGSVSQQLMYYINGVGGVEMLARRVYILAPLLIVLACIVLTLAPRPKKIETVALGMIFFASYVLPTMNQTKSAYLGVGFQSLWLMFVLYLVNELFGLQDRFRSHPNAPRMICIVAVLGSMVLFSWPSEPGEGSTSVGRNRIAAELFAALRSNYKGVDRPNLITTSAGPMINGDLFAYLALRDDFKVINTAGDAFTFDPDSFRKLVSWQDFVIASESGIGEAAEGLPTTVHMDDSLAIVRQCDEMRQVATVTTYTGRHYYLFARDLLIPDVYEPFSGFWVESGLGDLEGPYPQYKMPIARCGYAPHTVLGFSQHSDGPAVAILSVQSELPSQIVNVQLNGHTISQFNASEGGFYRHVVRMNAQAGTNQIQFDYSVHENAPVNPKAIIFRRLQIMSLEEFNRRYAFETQEPPSQP